MELVIYCKSLYDEHNVFGLWKRETGPNLRRNGNCEQQSSPDSSYVIGTVSFWCIYTLSCKSLSGILTQPPAGTFFGNVK